MFPNQGESRKHSRNSADNLEKPHRSDRLKRRHLVKKVSCSTTTQQDHTSVLVKEMGGSCSSELEELKKENKLLKNRIMLYENGITDSSIHASQTNIGLLNVSSESNNECSCSSNWISIIEVVGILMVTLITIYILYGWCCRYFTYRKGEKERRKAKLLAEMQRRIGMNKEETALEISHCEKTHIPDYNETTFNH